MIFLIILAAIFVSLGVIILIGKGDNLIAGYNIASKDEKEQYSIKRLRVLIGGLLIVLAPMMIIMLGKESLAATGSFIASTLFVCFVVVVLANNWAKKKSK